MTVRHLGVCAIVAVASVLTLSIALGAEDEIPQLHSVVRVDVKPDAAVFKSGKPLPVSVILSNETVHPIRLEAFTLEPTDWDGEVACCSVTDVYRDDDPMSLAMGTLEVPRSPMPLHIQGMGATPIEAHGSLTVRLELNKWQIRGGWVPGKYKVVLRVNSLLIDDYSRLAVSSEPFHFTIEPSEKSKRIRSSDQRS